MQMMNICHWNNKQEQADNFLALITHLSKEYDFFSPLNKSFKGVVY